MGLARTNGGLYVPQGSYEAAILRALQEHDSDLRLVPQGRDRDGRTYWKVARYCGSERPVEFILTWGDADSAYPLSFAIVDEVKRHDRNSRGFDAEDSDTLNKRLLEERARESRELGEAIAEYHGDRMAGKKKTVLHAGRNLQLSRIRQRRFRPPELRP